MVELVIKQKDIIIINSHRKLVADLLEQQIHLDFWTLSGASLYPTILSASLDLYHILLKIPLKDDNFSLLVSTQDTELLYQGAFLPTSSLSSGSNM